jgi:hypothetical protein
MHFHLTFRNLRRHGDPEILASTMVPETSEEGDSVVGIMITIGFW